MQLIVFINNIFTLYRDQKPLEAQACNIRGKGGYGEKYFLIHKYGDTILHSIETGEWTLGRSCPYVVAVLQFWLDVVFVKATNSKKMSFILTKYFIKVAWVKDDSVYLLSNMWYICLYYSLFITPYLIRVNIWSFGQISNQPMI